MRGWMLALALLAASGCFGGPAADAGAAVPGGGGPATLEVVAVDEAIRPLAGVTVTVDPPGRSAATGADGKARLDGLKAGEAAVLAEKAGFLPARTTAALAPGAAGPPVVLVLVADVRDARYVEATKDETILQAAASAGVDDLYGPATVAVTGGSRFRLDGPLPAWLQSEATWTPTQPLGDRLAIALWVCPGQDDTTGMCKTEDGGSGPSPVHVGAAAETVLEMGYEEGFEVFPSLAAVPPSPGGATVLLQQSVTVFTHAFHGFAPPPGWLFSRDGEPVVPPA